MGDTKATQVNTSLILTLSAMLIVNSHLEAYYAMRWMAADGLYGNSMFYMLSGFGVQSTLLGRRQGFAAYYLRRLVRIYPGVFMVLAVVPGLIGGGFWSWSAADYRAVFLWPTPFTYVGLIIPFYAVAYFVAAPRSRAVIWAALALAGVVYGGAYWRDISSMTPGETLQLGSRSILVHASFYAAAVLLGMLLAGRGPVERDWPAAGLLGATLAAYVVLKFVMVVKGWLSAEYFLLHGLIFVACFLSFRVLTSVAVTSRVHANPLLKRVLVFVGGLTLEVYLVHQVLLDAAPLHKLPFGLNILALVAVTLALAPIVRWVTAPIRERVDQATASGAILGKPAPKVA